MERSDRPLFEDADCTENTTLLGATTVQKENTKKIKKQEQNKAYVCLLGHNPHSFSRCSNMFAFTPLKTKRERPPQGFFFLQISSCRTTPNGPKWRTHAPNPMEPMDQNRPHGPPPFRPLRLNLRGRHPPRPFRAEQEQVDRIVERRAWSSRNPHQRPEIPEKPKAQRIPCSIGSRSDTLFWVTEKDGDGSQRSAAQLGVVFTGFTCFSIFEVLVSGSRRYVQHIATA